MSTASRTRRRLIEQCVTICFAMLKRKRAQDLGKDAICERLTHVVVPVFVPKSNANIVTDESVKKTEVKKVGAVESKSLCSPFGIVVLDSPNLLFHSKQIQPITPRSAARSRVSSKARLFVSSLWQSA